MVGESKYGLMFFSYGFPEDDSEGSRTKFHETYKKWENSLTKISKKKNWVYIGKVVENENKADSEVYEALGYQAVQVGGKDLPYAQPPLDWDPDTGEPKTKEVRLQLMANLDGLKDRIAKAVKKGLIKEKSPIAIGYRTGEFDENNFPSRFILNAVKSETSLMGYYWPYMEEMEKESAHANMGNHVRSVYAPTISAMGTNRSLQLKPIQS